MMRKRYTEEQIIRILKEAESGLTLGDLTPYEFVATAAPKGGAASKVLGVIMPP